jgi:hypothetical protein
VLRKPLHVHGPCLAMILCGLLLKSTDWGVAHLLAPPRYLLLWHPSAPVCRTDTADVAVVFLVPCLLRTRGFDAHTCCALNQLQPTEGLARPAAFGRGSFLSVQSLVRVSHLGKSEGVRGCCAFASTLAKAKAVHSCRLAGRWRQVCGGC